jgi:beta-lactamase class A
MISRRQWMSGTAALGTLALGSAVPSSARAAGSFATLPTSFARIEATRGGRLGVAVLDTGNGQQAGHRQEERFALCSTFKLLAAAAVLARADAGQVRMDQRIRYTRQELVEYSPTTEKHVGGNGMTLAGLCEAAMILSDNTAANLLLRDILESPAGLTAWLRQIGDATTRLDRNEPTLNESVGDDHRDTSSPAAMVATLRKLALGDALSPGSRTQLVGWLRGNLTGDKRLKARLPGGWQAGEKTGTYNGTRTSNDVGLLWPPNGAAPILVAAYLTEGAADGNIRDAALADVGAAVAAAWTGRA